MSKNMTSPSSPPAFFVLRVGELSLILLVLALGLGWYLKGDNVLELPVIAVASKPMVMMGMDAAVYDLPEIELSVNLTTAEMDPRK